MGSTAPQATYLIWPTGHRQHCSTGATYPVGHNATSKSRPAYCDIECIYICKTAPLGIGSTAPQATYLIWPTGHRQHCSTGATYPVGHGAASKGRTAYCDIDIYICKTAPLGMGSTAPQATCLIWPTKHWQHCSTGATYLMWPTGHRQRLHRRHIIPQTRYRLAMTLEARAAQHTALTTASKGYTTYGICSCEKI